MFCRYCGKNMNHALKCPYCGRENGPVEAGSGFWDILEGPLSTGGGGPQHVELPEPVDREARESLKKLGRKQNQMKKTLALFSIVLAVLFLIVLVLNLILFGSVKKKNAQLEAALSEAEARLEKLEETEKVPADREGTPAETADTVTETESAEEGDDSSDSQAESSHSEEPSEESGQPDSDQAPSDPEPSENETISNA